MYVHMNVYVYICHFVAISMDVINIHMNIHRYTHTHIESTSLVHLF